MDPALKAHLANINLRLVSIEGTLQVLVEQISQMRQVPMPTSQLRADLQKWADEAEASTKAIAAELPLGDMDPATAEFLTWCEKRLAELGKPKPS